MNESSSPRLLVRLRKLLFALANVSAAAVIGWLDVILGPSISLWALYVLPIGTVSWFAGARAASMMAVLSTALMIITQLGAWPLAGPAPWIAAWNTVSILGVFTLAALFPANVHVKLMAQSLLAREDQLTHIPNKLSFTEQLPIELKAAAGRHAPITVGLVEVHGIAYVNERFGTSAGDNLLRSTAATLRETLGKEGLIGRIGGTTFAVVLPGKNEDAARTTLEGVREQMLRKIDLYDRPISIAIAAVSTDKPSGEGRDLLLDRTGWLLQSIKQSRTLHPFRVVGESEIHA